MTDDLSIISFESNSEQPFNVAEKDYEEIKAQDSDVELEFNELNKEITKIIERISKPTSRVMCKLSFL